jgi:nucleoside-diphosphate-sugar epimerase
LSRKTIGITGGTGFVGKALIREANSQGWHVRALTRAPRDPQDGVEWVIGTLEETDRLLALAKDCDALIHVAGATTAPNRAAFEAANVTGTHNMVDAARAAGVQRFIHVSSLAAREAELSDYGWSKAKAETVVAASGLDWTMIRPPAVFGPGDPDHLELFKMARNGWIPMSPTKRLSVIEVSDLARALLAVIPHEDATAEIYQIDDGRDNGWSAESFAKAIGTAMDKRVSVIRLPRWIVKFGALIRFNPKLTRDRARYMCHPDWTIDVSKRPPEQIWTPQIATRAGLKAAAQSYRAAGLL